MFLKLQVVEESEEVISGVLHQCQPLVVMAEAIEEVMEEAIEEVIEEAIQVVVLGSHSSFHFLVFLDITVLFVLVDLIFFNLLDHFFVLLFNLRLPRGNRQVIIYYIIF